MNKIHKIKQVVKWIFVSCKGELQLIFYQMHIVLDSFKFACIAILTPSK